MHTIESKETIVRSQWCFKKNLLGHLLQNGTFQLIRVNYKAIRIKELTNSTDHTKMYTCFAFSPNNDQIAAGNNKGGFIIANIGDHFEINKRLHKDSLYWMKWLSLARQEELKDINPLAKNSNLDKFLPQIEAHKGSVADNIMKLNIFNSVPESYTLLVSLDTDSMMGLVLNGYFEITKFDMKTVLHRREAPNLFIHEILFEKTRDTLLVYHSEGGNIHKNMYLSLVDSSFLRYSKETVVRVTFYLNYLEEIYNNLNQTMDSMNNTLKNIKRFGSVFFDYEDLLKKEDKYSHLQPWQDILRIVKTGELSSSFHKFIKERFEAKNIIDTNTKLANEFNYIQEVLTDSVQSGIERALIITEQLQAEVSKGEHFSGLINILNIDAKAIEARFQSLLKKTEEYLFIVAETKLRQTNFYAWLYKSYKKYEVKIEEPADPAEKKVDDSILKNYTVDKLTLLKFLNSEDSFNMRYLYQFFSPQAEDLELEQYNFEYKNQAPRLNELEANVNEEIEAVVRKQTLDMALSSINRFALETFGVAMEQAKIPMREEKINESRGNFKSLLKGINEAILAAKTQFSECLNSNIKLEKSIDLGSFVFRKDFHTFSYQEQENSEILIVFTKKSENTQKNHLVALKLKSLSELRKRISISLVEIPSEKVVLDLALSPSNSIVLITVSEEGGSRASTSEIQILDMGGLEWTELQMIESKNVFYVKQKLEDMIERGPLNEFVPLKTKRLPSSDYGFIHANVKGLMSVSDGHNTIIISDD